MFAESQQDSLNRAEYIDCSDAGTSTVTLVQDGSGSESLSPFASLSLPHLDCENVARRRDQAVTLHYMLWDIFVSVWDRRSSLWLSTSCNPFLETSIVRVVLFA